MLGMNPNQIELSTSNWGELPSSRGSITRRAEKGWLRAGYSLGVTVANQVKETQPEPQPCTVALHWLPPISLDDVHHGGSVVPIKFHLHQCSSERKNSPPSKRKFLSNDVRQRSAR